MAKSKTQPRSPIGIVSDGLGPHPQRKAAERAYAEQERAAASLIVTEQQLDHMFTSWPLEDKVMCIQLWLDRLDGR